MALTDNLLAFYKLSDLTDSSGNNRTLTNNGSVSFASGKIGNAAIIDGDQSGGKYLASPVNGGLTNTGFSYSTWFKWNGNQGGEFAVATLGDGFGWVLGVQFAFGTPSIDYIAGNGGWATYEKVLETAEPNVWYHLVKSADSNGVKMYLNGQLAGTYPFVDWTDAPIEIGHWAYNNGSQDWSWDGSIDAVGIWNRALSDSEVAALYNNGTGLELDGVAQPTLVKMQAPVKFFGKIKFGV